MKKIDSTEIIVTGSGVGANDHDQTVYQSCDDAWHKGKGVSGTYLIGLKGVITPMYCEMEVRVGGGR